MRYLALVLFASCSDYDLNGKEKEPKDTRPEREDDVEQDSATVADSGTTGGGTVTDTDEPDPDEPAVEGRVDVVLVMDIAYWYDCYRVELPTRTAELVNALFDSGVDVGVSIVSYDDYNVDGEWWVAYGGVPYTLDLQISTDRAQVLAVASGLEFNWGGDGPGTGFEALLQATSGRGYDQDCDGGFDRDNDIKPYKADSVDAFGGGVNGSRDSGVSGTGSLGGVGFREDSKRVLVVFAENELRDRALGHDTPNGACLGVAGRTEAADALGALDAKFLGVNAYEFQDEDDTLQRQLEDFADRTSSKIDADGDGARDDKAVLAGSWDWPATTVIVESIWDLAER